VIRLAGRVAVVTGASRGIGLAIAESLSGAGADVVRLARSLVPRRTRGYSDIPCDVTREGEVQRVAETLNREGRVPDILVNNAGVFLLRPLVETTATQFREQLEVNLVGPFLVLRAFLPAMRTRGSGHIVTIGSVADHVGLPGNAAYSASKYGLRGLHEVLTAELKDTGIVTTLIAPGATDTALWDSVDRAANPGLPARESMLRPADVARMVTEAVCL